jgi:hypothetical protein
VKGYYYEHLSQNTRIKVNKVEFLEKALQYFDQAGAKSELKRAIGKLLKLYITNNNNEKSLKLLEKYGNIYNEYFDGLDSFNALYQSNYKYYYKIYELEKELKIIEIEKENKKRAYTIILLVIVIILVLVGVKYFHNYHKRKVDYLEDKISFHY